MVVVDGQGVPLACRAASGSPAEITLVEGLLDGLADQDPAAPIPLIADRAYDSDRHRTRLLQRGWDLVCPHRRGRKRPKTQDERKLRRYRRRWKIERTIGWLQFFRRLVVRYEHYSFIYQGFLHLACIAICLRRF
jgi:transposase